MQIAGLLSRELRALRREVAAYPTDEALWRLPPGLPNAAGTLALHLAGNVQHYVGHCLGGSGYARDRDAEFARRDVPRAELLAEIDRALAVVGDGLARTSPTALAAPFPEVVGGWRVRTDEFLLHLVAHFGYHLGQIDYHRRVVTGDARGIRAIAVAELGSAERVGPPPALAPLGEPPAADVAREGARR